MLSISARFRCDASAFLSPHHPLKYFFNFSIETSWEIMWMKSNSIVDWWLMIYLLKTSPPISKNLYTASILMFTEIPQFFFLSKITLQHHHHQQREEDWVVVVIMIFQRHHHLGEAKSKKLAQPKFKIEQNDIEEEE